jgi:hypothetical protein
MVSVDVTAADVVAAVSKGKTAARVTGSRINRVIPATNPVLRNLAANKATRVAVTANNAKEAAVAVAGAADAAVIAARAMAAIAAATIPIPKASRAAARSKRRQPR